MGGDIDFCIRERDNFPLKKSMLREIHQTPPKLDMGPAQPCGLYLIRFNPTLRYGLEHPLTRWEIPLKSNSITIELDFCRHCEPERRSNPLINLEIASVATLPRNDISESKL